MHDLRAILRLAAAVQESTGQTAALASVDQGYTGEASTADAAAPGIELEMVKHPAGTHGFVVLPRRSAVERSFAWKTRFHRLVRDDERLTTTLAGLRFVAFAYLALARATPLLASNSQRPLAGLGYSSSVPLLRRGYPIRRPPGA